MLKQILYGSGTLSVLTAGYFLGSVTLGGAFAQTAPTMPAAPTTAQTAPAAKETATNEQSETANEQAQHAALASQAKITVDQANTAALTGFPGGTVKKTELDNENGTLAYDVKLTDSAGKTQEVVVDATSGQVLVKAAEAPETPDAPETGSETAD